MYYTDEELEEFVSKVRKIVTGKQSKNKKLKVVCELLRDNVAYYDWVGFYMADDKKRELILGPFVGESTEHTRIFFGQGICGQAAVIKKPFVVQDVSKETNYLSCSAKVMSEIVVPILRKNGKVVGELDIDSHTLSPFTEKDTMFLEKICKVVSILFQK